MTGCGTSEPMTKPPTSSRSIRLRDDQWAALTAAAERAERSVNYLVGQGVDLLLMATTPNPDHIAVGPVSGALIEEAVADRLKDYRPSLARKLSLPGGGEITGAASSPAARAWTGGHPKPGAKKR